MAKGVDFACPNCGKENFVSLTQVKKNLKGNVPITFPCGHSSSPNDILDKLGARLASVLDKTIAKLPK
jgi:transcription elongation factor Elf1